jgi:DNA-binding transcriptional MerR regulator
MFFRGVLMRPTRGDGYLTTAESARLVGRKPVTIRQWRKRGYLVAQGLDERGYPLHSRQAVRAAERIARDNGLQASGVDPRQVCAGPQNLAA